jgi:hypothetical protein
MDRNFENIECMDIANPDVRAGIFDVRIGIELPRNP